MATVTASRNTDLLAPAQWAPFRSLLLVGRAVCVRLLMLVFIDTVASGPHPFSLARTARLLRTIEEIDAALGRLEAGAYGRCVSCGGAIPVERLEFRPFAAGCVTCEQQAA